MRADLIDLLRCPSCRSRFRASGSQNGEDGSLTCEKCGRSVAVTSGIPRFAHVPADVVARRTQASFGYEWTHFNDWRQSGETNFSQYFQDVDLTSLRGKLVLDAGCGMGRHARQLAPFAGRVIAVDFSQAV